MMRSTVQPLHRLIVQFNFLPSLELHPDHRGTIVGAPVWDALTASPAGHKQLSAAILERERLQDDWVTAFQTRERRVALLGWQPLEQLLLLAGVALNAVWVATRISRSDVAAVKTALGPELYGFAVGRARFLGDVAPWPEPQDSAALLSWVTRAGLRYLEGCTQQQPRAVAARLKLRLPRLPALDPNAAQPLPLPEPERATGLFRKLAPEVGEPCISLLA
jgi:hypothetical protein